MKTGKINVELIVIPKIEMTLWDAIKIRLSGLNKNIQFIEKVGECIKVSYKNSENTLDK